MNWVFESSCFYLDLLAIALDLCASGFPFCYSISRKCYRFPLLSTSSVYVPHSLFFSVYVSLDFVLEVSNGLW